MIYLQVLESPHPIRYSARPGDLKQLHSSAIGKAMLGAHNWVGVWYRPGGRLTRLLGVTTGAWLPPALTPAE